MPPETIAIASDHAGVGLKSVLKEDLAELGFAVLDLGTQDEQSVDYPDMADALANAIGADGVTRGVAICGSTSG